MAGGTGSRMHADIPKQFLLLAGQPVLMHSLNAFQDAFPGISIVLALPASQFAAWDELCSLHSFLVPHQVVAGGETRFHSVQNALACVDDEGLVAVHDGARPLISPALIRDVFLTAGEHGNCIPAIPMRESARIVSEKGLSSAVDRNIYRIVQTPQVFHTATLKKAYAQKYRESFTDDAIVVEGIGEQIHLVDGDPVNLKITYPYDLAAAEVLIAPTLSSLSIYTAPPAPAPPPTAHK